MSKITIFWKDEKPSLEETSKEDFLKMFPELEKFVEHFDPLSIHVVLKNNKSITINF